MTAAGDADVLERLFLLPSDAMLVPVRNLSPRVRATLGCGDEDDSVAVTRAGFRVPTRLVSPDLAALLAEFRQPSRIADAVLRYSQSMGTDPLETVDDAFAALASFTAFRLLVPADAAAADAVVATLAPGELVAGYQVERLVRAMEDTEVYRATTSSGADVAVKIARPAAPADVIESLDREAAVLRHLDGSSSPRLVGADRHDGRPFLALDWCPGVPVAAAAQRARAGLGPGRRSLHRLGRGVLKAYAALHQRDVIHGDIHPGNVLVEDDGSVLVLDYGRAQVLSADIQAAPARAGIAYFYEPELARALQAGLVPPPPTFAGEQYSLAALLYYLLTGVHYVDLSAEQDRLVHQVLHRSPLPFSARGMEPWPAVEAVLAIALAKQPGDRFPSVSALVEAFDAAEPGPVASALHPHRLERPGSHLLARALDEARRDPSSAPDPDAVDADPAAAIDLAQLALRAACVRDDPDLLARADVWSLRARPAGGWATCVTAATAAAIHRARMDGGSQGAAVATFLRCVAELGEDLDLLGGRSGGLLMAAHVLDGLDDGGADRQPLARWVRQTIDEIWHTIDGWAPVGWCAELPHLGLAHGWAGLLYATLHACRATGTPSPPGLVARLDELAGLAQPYGRGVRWTGTVPSATTTRTPSLAPGWCSGTAGHALLWTLAYTELGAPRHLALAERAGWYAVGHAATDPTLCCGTAGRALALLALYQVTGERSWLVESERLAASAAVSWERDERPYGLRTGALGTALLLVELEAPERASFPVLSP